jgi:hypothetical protein
VSASPVTTRNMISCAADVAAARVKPGVWLLPFGSVGIAKLD